MDRSCSRSARVRRRGLALGALGLVLAGGCQSYERRPLDLAGHGAAFLARTPDSPEVRAFADRLAAETREAGTFDLSDGISCTEAEVIALVFNAELRVARLRAGVARATAENSGLWEDTTLGVDLARIVDGTPEPWKVSGSVGLTIPISGRLALEKALAEESHAAELARVGEREWAVRMGVRRAWAEWSALVAQGEATREFMARMDQILAVVDAMERSGEMARAEARLFRIERATKGMELAAIESRAREADLRLRGLMGLSPDAPLRLAAEGVGPARRGGPVTGDHADLSRRSPAVLVARAEHEEAERTLALEVRRQYPDLHLGPGVGREDGRDQVLLGVSVPLPLVNANRRGIAEARARREVARAGAEAALEQAIGALRAAERRLASAARRREVLETQIVPLVDAQYEDARRMARLGEVSTLVLLESLKRQHEAKAALIEAARDEALAGVDVDEVLGPATGPATGSGPIPSGEGR